MGRRPQIPVVLLTHPFEIVLGLALIANAFRGLVLGQVSPSIDALPPITRVAYLLVSSIGGLGVVTGLVIDDRGTAKRDRNRRALGLALERACLYVVSASYAGLGLAVVASNQTNGLGTATVVGIVAIGCILRTVAIRRTVRVVIRTLHEERLKQGDGDA